MPVQGDVTSLMQTGPFYEHYILPDDKISLSIWNHDDLSIGSVFNIYNSNEAYGKWVVVEANGHVQLPKLGNVRMGGLTCSEASEKLSQLYAEYLIDPIVVVKVLNREVTVLGEVRTPGTYILEKERNTLTDLIGKAQGFETYADYKKVQLIRNGISYTIDLTTLDDSMSHMLVVETGDIINVPSRNGKTFDRKITTLIPLASVITALGVVASIFLR
ncbi:MAG: polysaccharide export outer membrane protein [Psychroserpens sp.]|jgi:polysaccharide export outer membrane protein